MVRYVPKERKELPDINKYVERLIYHVDLFLSKTDEEWGALGQVIKHQDSLVGVRKKRIKKALSDAAKRAQKFADQF
jgi:hypothetical protein